MSIATFSDELKIFNSDEPFSLSASASVSKAGATFGRITWSGDAKWIAVAPIQGSNDTLPIFKFKDNDLLSLTYVTLKNITSASFFNWTNRNIAVGAENGNIYVWDIKEKKVAVNVDIEEKQTVDHICMNSDDGFLASGSLNSNKIFIHSLKTNKVVNKFIVPKSEHVSSLRFCMCKKSYLAASSYESTVCVWDIIHSDFVFKSLNSHCGACTDISFSPINYSVMASVGLTKTLKMYDLREKKSIFDVDIGECLQSVDMVANGDKVVLGTAGGSVIIYDLRANKVFHNFNAHAGPVLSVKMQLMKKPKSYQEVEINTPEIVEAQNKTLDLSVMDIFSPICRASESKSVISSKSVTFHSTPKIIVSDDESMLPYNDSFLSKMLSPKQEKNSILSPIMQQQQPSYCKKSDFIYNGSKLGTVEEEPVDVKENGSKLKVDNATYEDRFCTQEHLSNDCIQNILKEIKMIHKEQQESIKNLSDKISSIEKELNTMKLDNECKYQTLQENYENLIDVLINGIKQEIYIGNCDGKLEHICQRHLINNISNLISEKSDLVINEINKYVQKINLIHKKLGDIQK